MPFGLWGPNPQGGANFGGNKAAQCNEQGELGIGHTKMAEPVKMSFGVTWA